MKKDWLLFTDIVLIVAIGLTTLYSTVVGTENIFGGGGVVNRQLIFVLIGFGVYFGFSYLDYRFSGHPQVIVPLFVITIIALVLLLVFGVEVNNAKRWIFIGNAQLQPSEFAKIVMIMTTGWVFSLKRHFNVWLLAGISFVLTLVLAVLIFLEPDAGTALILVTIWGLMAFSVLPDQVRNILVVGIMLLAAAGINLLLTGGMAWGIAITLLAIGISALSFAFTKYSRWIMILALFLGLGVGLMGRVMWDSVLADYQKERIETFINPSEDTQGAGFQVDQSKVAIGSGMLFGKGFGHGTQSKLKFLPEHQTDFVFAAFAEEFGMIGALFVLGLYGFAVLRIFQISSLTKDVYGTLLCVGVGVKILLEVFVNIGMNLGVIPATGVPLPLMSAGGSIFLVTMIALGLVQSVRIHIEEKDREIKLGS